MAQVSEGLDYYSCAIREPISREDILLYEVHSSLFYGLCPGFLHGLAGKYLAWKVNRKYARYKRSLGFASRCVRFRELRGR